MQRYIETVRGDVILVDKPGTSATTLIVQHRNDHYRKTIIQLATSDQTSLVRHLVETLDPSLAHQLCQALSEEALKRKKDV